MPAAALSYRPRTKPLAPLRGSAGGCFKISQIFFCLANKGKSRVPVGFFRQGGLTLHGAMPYLGERQPIRGSYGASRFTP